MRSRYRRTRSGLSLTELIVTAAILAIMAGLVIPLAKVTVQRRKEMELRFALRVIRSAIDAFHRAVRPPNRPNGPFPQVRPAYVLDEDTGYPKRLEYLTIMIEVTPPNQVKSRKYRFLRRIPKDPMTGSTDWGLLCLQDEPPPKDWVWCGQNVYDVYSKSRAQALDGSYYYEW